MDETLINPVIRKNLPVPGMVRDLIRERKG